MGFYLDLIKKTFFSLYTYKAYSLITIASRLLRLFIMISVWTALIGKSGSIENISLNDMLNYLIITTIINTLSSSQSSKSISAKVRDGSISLDFIKPVNHKFLYLSEDIGNNLYNLLFQTIPVIIVITLFYNIKIYFDPVYVALFIVSLFNGIVLIYLIFYSFGLLSFWLKTSYYTDWTLDGFFLLFSGRFVPLWFYPKFLFNISRYLPFRLTSFDPISIYLQKVTVNQAVTIIGLQFIWILVFYIIEKIMWKNAQNAVVVHGG